MSWLNNIFTMSKYCLLWDLRRSVADDVAYEYVGGLRKASNPRGLKIWLENYGHWGYPGEFLMYGGQTDLVGGEFWIERSLGDIECKSASAAAHIYGKPITSAEAFTAGLKSYTRHPALLKKRGDWSFTEGINHYTTTTVDDVVAGEELAASGLMGPVSIELIN